MNQIVDRLKETIRIEIERLKTIGEMGPFYVVPVANIRCFVPCQPGHCICHASVDRFCVVNEAGKKKALQHANSEIEFLNQKLKEVVDADSME